MRGSVSCESCDSFWSQGKTNKHDAASEPLTTEESFLWAHRICQKRRWQSPQPAKHYFRVWAELRLLSDLPVVWM